MKSTNENSLICNISLWVHAEGNSFLKWDDLIVPKNADNDLIQIFKDYEKINYYPFNMVLIYNETQGKFIVIDENYSQVESFSPFVEMIKKYNLNIFEKNKKINSIEQIEISLPTIRK